MSKHQPFTEPNPEITKESAPNFIAKEVPPQNSETKAKDTEETQQPLEKLDYPDTERAEATATPKSKQTSEQRSNWKKYWWLLPTLGLVLVIGGVTFVRLRDNSEPIPVTKTAPLSVRTVTVGREPIRAWVSSEGRVRAVEYQHLTFEVEGDVTFLAEQNGRRLREGDFVTAGTLLAQVDDRELVADVRQAEAALAEARQQRAAAAADVAQARSQVAQAQAQVQQARSQLETARSARTLAATNLERYRLLVQEGAISASEFDTRQNALEDAQAQVGSAQSQISAAQSQVAVAQAQVQAAQERLDATQSGIVTAQARLDQAQVALEGASIYAPFDGIIAYLNYTEGQYFSPQLVTSQLGGDYQGILERIPMVIIDPSRYEVIVDLAGTNAAAVQAGQTALVADDTNTDSDNLIANARATGEVFAVNPAVSPGGRAIEARIRLNPETTATIRHGERVLTWIAVAADPQAVVVPLNAVIRREQTPYVFVVNKAGVVEQRQVELGIRGITQQEIERGVEVGEAVVTAGQNRLVDGASVQVVN